MARVLMKGNEAMAEAAIQAGCQAFFGYPITPQSEIPEYFARELPPRGGLFLQAESEMAAMNMVMGASAAGRWPVYHAGDTAGDFLTPENIIRKAEEVWEEQRV